MNITVFPSVATGDIRAISSKSVAHRLLICAAFADKPSVIRCEQINEDIIASVECLCALGADISRKDDCFYVIPIKTVNENVTLPCNESGSTLRFILPICAALGGTFTFDMRGRLSSRPLSPLKELLENNGIKFSHNTENTLTISGAISGNSFQIAGNVSSQFITGLIFALAILKKKATLEITTKIESKPYIDITLDALATFGINIIQEENTFIIPSKCNFIAPESLNVEGDWSNAAFTLALGIIGKEPIKVENLLPDSKQGDKQIIEILRAFGGRIEESENGLTAYPSRLCGTEIDATDIPDLVPILATVASVADGTTVISGAARLRLKESDRLMSVSTVLSNIGAEIYQTDDGLIIKGKKTLAGGVVDSFGDHRIAMSMAIIGSICENPVTIHNAQAVNKSYPRFWKDLEALKIHYEEN